MIDTVTPDLCPVHTCDEAVIWLAENKCVVSFWLRNDGRTAVWIDHDKAEVKRAVGDGGFDARGTLMMATRDLWAKVNKAVKA